jgi:hypothetical protein
MNADAEIDTIKPHMFEQYRVGHLTVHPLAKQFIAMMGVWCDSSFK